MFKLHTWASLVLVATGLAIASPLAPASADPIACEPGR